MSAEDTALIDAYLYHRLTPEERTTFEARIQLEPELAEALALERAVQLAGLELLMSEMEQSIDEIKANPSPAQRSPLRIAFSSSVTRWSIGIAASLALLLAFWFWQQTPSTLSPQALAQEYLPLLEGQSSFRSADSPEAASNSTVQAFNAAFNQRNFALCKALLPQIELKNAQDSLDARIKWAWIDLMEGKISPAETQFQALQQNPALQNMPLSIRENVDYGLYLSRFLQGKKDETLQNQLKNSTVYGERMRKLALEKRLNFNDR